ncbi:MAG: sigma-70 family RNA polymerase sigma factor [Oscillospiraceae bacterium]|nr:sigma-70 family RNA polymerase sigma factor [Oscillospiraceae bacterium]
MEDKQIVELYFQRDNDAIKETDAKYGSFCFTVANNILHNAEDAEECVNDTWLRAWNAIPPHRPVWLKSFLAKITQNLALDRYTANNADKRGGSEINLVLEEISECISSGETPANAYDAKELEECIGRFVKALSERDGNIFVRRYFFMEKTAETAKKYGMKESNVLLILSRTRKKLKAHLIKEGFVNE